MCAPGFTDLRVVVIPALRELLQSQQRFLLKVESKIEYYATIHDKPERWVALSEGADEDEKVAPIPLSMLP